MSWDNRSSPNKHKSLRDGFVELFPWWHGDGSCWDCNITVGDELADFLIEPCIGLMGNWWRRWVLVDYETVCLRLDL